jgi:hypothetical protein
MYEVPPIFEMTFKKCPYFEIFSFFAVETVERPDKK